MSMNHEIRWHGRGGQGAISSAQILAQAAYCAKFRGVTSAPSFGAERRGAPVTASTRLSPEPLRIFSQIEFPDIVIVLDDTLLTVRERHGGTETRRLAAGQQPLGATRLGFQRILRDSDSGRHPGLPWTLVCS